MILAGDIGGTKTLLGLFEPAPSRPTVRAVREFVTLDFGDLPSMIEEFLRDQPAARGAIDAACFGVAGPILGDTAQLTNVPWGVDARRVGDLFGIRRVALVNDLAATAYSVRVLLESELRVLQAGEALASGNIAVIAAGTGLGQALLHHVEGRFVPSPSEAGHADFAARTEREIALVRALTARFGRVEVERVLSGPGLVNIHRALTSGECPASQHLDDPGAPARISAAALAGTSACCVEALGLFVEAYGAEAGNLALRTVSTGGVFIGGGIAPKILPALTNGAFMRAFRAKAPFDRLLERVPVKVILNPEAALIGAAVCAAGG